VRRFVSALSLLCIMSLGYLAFWPVPVRPVAWVAPDSADHSGDFAQNDRLADLEWIDLAGRFGPEGAAVGPDGLIYAATHGGEILRVGEDVACRIF